MKKLVVVALTVGLSLTGIGSIAAPATADATEAFHPAALNWHACPQNIVSAAARYDSLSSVKVSKVIQCAELQVPLDYTRPEGQKITLQLTRTPHTGTDEAKGDILVNPGGPGGSGTAFGARVFAQNSAPMQAAYNVIGFDPRGVGDSVPSLHCDADYSNAPRPAYGDGSKQDVDIWLKRSKGYADACYQKYGAGSPVDLLDHIKTIDSVRDMDTIRMALGNKKLDYYGASYGTYLGQVYATVFPKRVGRMALDGNVGPKDVWYEANLNQDYAFDKNMEYYFGWIARYDSYYHLGKTQAEVHSLYYDLLAHLTKAPVFHGGDAVGPDELVDTVQNAAYRRSAGLWNRYAAALSAYQRGDVTTFVNTFGAQTTGGSDDNDYAVYNAVQCTDVQWPMSWQKWYEDNTRIHQVAPFLTWANAWFNAPCLYWGAKAGTPVEVGATKHLPDNILMFQSTEDAATPLQGALQAHEILRGSHMVIQDGDRTHCIVHRGDLRPGGVDSYFDAYFLDGNLPDETTVHVSQLGDPVPPAAKTPLAAASAAPSAAELER